MCMIQIIYEPQKESSRRALLQPNFPAAKAGPLTRADLSSNIKTLAQHQRMMQKYLFFRLNSRNSQTKKMYKCVFFFIRSVPQYNFSE